MFSRVRIAIRFFFVGLAVGVLLAPRSGEETRRMLREKADSLLNDVLDAASLGAGTSAGPSTAASATSGAATSSDTTDTTDATETGDEAEAPKRSRGNGGRTRSTTSTTASEAGV
jgi:gas vesicle protein